MLSSFIAGLAGVLIAPLFAQTEPTSFTTLLVAAIAAAAFARLTSIPMALLGGLLLGILQGILAGYLPVGSILANGLRPSLPFVTLFALLLFWPGLRQKAELTDPLAGVDPPPPGLAAAERSRGLTIGTRTFGTIVGTAVVVISLTALNTHWLDIVTGAVIFSLIFLSITVITGMAGQISLCQATFAAVGGFTTAQLADNLGSPLLSLLVGVVFAAIVGALIAIPSLRLGGIYLALATLAFALMFDSVLVPIKWIGGGQLPPPVPRPGFLDRRPRVLRLRDRAARRGRGDRRPRPPWDHREVPRRAPRQRDRRDRVGDQRGASAGDRLRALRRHRRTRRRLARAARGTGQLHRRTSARSSGLFWMVLVVTLGSRTVEGAIQAGFAFALFPELLQALGVPGEFQFVLFGLSAVVYAKHPEGVLEFGKRKQLEAIQRGLDRRNRSGAPEAPAQVPS